MLLNYISYDVGEGGAFILIAFLEFMFLMNDDNGYVYFFGLLLCIVYSATFIRVLHKIDSAKMG